MTDSARYDRTSLAWHCAREYEWSPSIALTLVNEFLDKFIPIKRYLRDYDATICSPPPVLDKVWHVALLYTREYQTLCGNNFIHHSPAGEFDRPEVKLKRYRETQEAYKELFGDFMDQIAWYLPDMGQLVGEAAAVKDSAKNDENAIATPLPRKRRQVFQEVDGNTQEGDSDEPILRKEELAVTRMELLTPGTPVVGSPAPVKINEKHSSDGHVVSVMNNPGGIVNFRVSSRTLIRTVQEHVQRVFDIPEGGFGLYFQGKGLGDCYTIGDYEIEDGDCIDALVNHSGC
jgi:hypothetical protein